MQDDSRLAGTRNDFQLSFTEIYECTKGITRYKFVIFDLIDRSLT